MNRANQDIRDKAREKRIPLWQIAYRYGYADNTFSRKLRFELNDEEKEKIFLIIEEIAKENDER